MGLSRTARSRSPCCASSSPNLCWPRAAEERSGLSTLMFGCLQLGSPTRACPRTGNPSFRCRRIVTSSSWHSGWLGSRWREDQGRGRMMPENAYESLVRRTYQDFESGDLDLLGVVMAQEVVWHEPGRSSLAGHYKGPEEVLGFLGELKARTG